MAAPEPIRMPPRGSWRRRGGEVFAARLYVKPASANRAQLGSDPGRAIFDDAAPILERLGGGSEAFATLIRGSWITVNLRVRSDGTLAL